MAQVGQRAVVADVLRAAQRAVVTGYKGQPVVLDQAPRCATCGRRLADYLARPWSLRCKRCGGQCTSE